MASAPEAKSEAQFGNIKKFNVTIASVFRNFPEEKCLELRTEQGVVFYYQSKFDPETGTTTDTVYGVGRSPQSLQCLSKGNQTTEVMQILFKVLPAAIPTPEFQ